MPWVSDWLSKASKAASASPAGDSPTSHSYEDEVEVRFIDDDSNSSSPFSNQPPTPDDNDIDPASVTMPMTSPIDIATPTRNASSSPSSQGKKPVYHDIDSRSSAMMSGTAFDSQHGARPTGFLWRGQAHFHEQPEQKQRWPPRGERVWLEALFKA